MPEENDVTSEQFAEEMHAEPKNIDGEPGVATAEEEAAAEAVEPSEPELAVPAEAAPVAVEPPSPEQASSEPAAATTQPEDAAPQTAESLAPEQPASEPAAATTQAEDATPPTAESLAPEQPASEPAAATVQAEDAAPQTAESLTPEQPGSEPAPVESLSPEELFAPDAAREQPKWPAEDAELTAVLEAVIYITDEPLTLEQMSAALEQPRERIKRLLDELVAEWQKPHHGLSIREVAGGYKMATKPEHHEAVRQFVKSLKPPMKLSLPALETLAVIAYKQPVTAPEIMDIRGVQGAGVLKTLLDRKLIAAAGRKNVIGKPILYKTTKEFLVQFGLKDLSELPSVKEFEELTRFASAEPEAPASTTAEAQAETQAKLEPQPEAVPEPVAE